jgi:hypothetical protein
VSSTSSARALAFADSDSYVKWAAGLLDQLPMSWERELAVVRTPITPSRAQIDAATSGTRFTGSALPVVTRRQFRRHVRSSRPDVVVAAATGPVVDVIVRDILRDVLPRPVLMSGLPGISIPATSRAWLYRSQVDLFVTHSRRERREFATLARQMGINAQVALATMPCVAHAACQEVDEDRNRVVFAAQAKVPPRRADREHILLSLAKLSAQCPDLVPVVKLRAVAGEPQTHREELAFDQLWGSLVADRRVRDQGVLFETGPMLEQISRAAGFVTVSSTAALEAIAAKVPSLVLADFGVSEEMINMVFKDSGLLGSLDDLASSAFRQPDPSWLRDNYFHPVDEVDWVDTLLGFVEQARTRGLPERRRVLDHSGYATRRPAVRRLRLNPGIVKARNVVGRIVKHRDTKERRWVGWSSTSEHRRRARS